jgi:hypothetical protein
LQVDYFYYFYSLLLCMFAKKLSNKSFAANGIKMNEKKNKNRKQKAIGKEIEVRQIKKLLIEIAFSLI